MNAPWIHCMSATALLAGWAGVPLWHEAFSMHGALKLQNDSGLILELSWSANDCPTCPTLSMAKDIPLRSRAPFGPLCRSRTTPSGLMTVFVQNSPVPLGPFLE